MSSTSNKGGKQKPTYIAEATHNDVNSSNQSSSIISCTVIGDTGIGKTTLLEALGEKTTSDIVSEGIFEKYEAQITARNGSHISINYTECPCSDEYSRLRSLSYRNTHVFFLCYSCINRSSFENAILQWYPEINMISPDAPVYIIGTQADLRNQILESGTSSLKKIVTEDEGIDLCIQIGGIQYIETSLDDTDALTIVLKQIAEAMLRQFEITELSSSNNWKKNVCMKLSHNNGVSNCMSPKEKHQREVRKRRKKESVAIIPASSTIGSNPSSLTPIKKKKLEKVNFRKSALPITFDDIIKDSDNIMDEENMNPNTILEISSGDELSSQSKKKKSFKSDDKKSSINRRKVFSLKQFRDVLTRITRGISTRN